MKYSVLDLETTGFSPKRGDKILEVSIININEEGEIQDTFESLVNPKRDIGASHVHGITAEMVINAPTFEDIYPEIMNRLNEGVVVAHNANFDLSFLNYEISQTISSYPNWNGICTLGLSRILNPELPSHKLKVLCEFFDIELSDEHRAFSDCQSTKTLFSILKENYEKEYGIDDFKNKFVRSNLIRCNPPKLNKGKREYKRTEAAESSKKSKSRLAEMIERLPEKSISSKLPVQEYLNLLEEILADRIITDEEAASVQSLAGEYKIAQEDLAEIHEEYLRRLVRVYLEDDVLSEVETQDLIKVANLLGLSDKLDLIVELEKAKLSSLVSINVSNSDKVKDKTVCFTGQLMSSFDGRNIDRSLAHQLVIERGMKPKKRVTKALDYLVVADPHTQSRKAQKARKYGIKIMADPVFWQMVGVKVS